MWALFSATVNAVVVGGTVAHAAANATAGHPHGEAVRLVIAAVPSCGSSGCGRIRPRKARRCLGAARAREGRTRARDWPVDRGARIAHALLEVAVVVPTYARDLDETHTRLHGTAGDQALAAEVVSGFSAHAVQVESGAASRDRCPSAEVVRVASGMPTRKNG